MSAPRSRRMLFVLVVMLTTGVLSAWATQPSVGTPEPSPGLAGHAQRYRQAFDRAFADAPAAVRAAAEVRARQIYTETLAGAVQQRDLAPQGATPCVDGHAGQWPCRNVDLLSFLPMSALGGGNANDLWGWTDPQTDKEYVVFGRTNGTAFVDISDPTNPIYLGNLPSHVGTSVWRAMKVYQNVAYIVADALPHGMQVFDLTRLRNVPNPPVTFTEDFFYSGMDNTHTLAVNEETGYLYAVGTNTCRGGLHMIDVHTNPLKPTFAGCYGDDGYVHETQCVVYHGPDVTYQGHEVCFAHDEDTVTIIDVTDKTNPVQISRTPYQGSGYTHQGWLTESQKVLVVNDELDEEFFGGNTRTRFFDVRDLDSIPPPRLYQHATNAIDHNLYVRGALIYETNYRAGLRVLAGGPVHEIGFFDVWPSDDEASFNGTWNNYPFFQSRVIALSGIEQGLFLVKLHRSPPQGSSDFIDLG